MRRTFSTSRSLIAVVLAMAGGAWAQFQPQQPYPAQPSSSQSYPSQSYPGQSYPASQPQDPQSGYPQGQQQYPPYASAPNQQQPPDTARDQAEDMRRGVGRISVVQGDVNVKRGDAGGEVLAAVMNAPLTTQDRLQTGQGARAEVQFDYGNVVQVGQGTDLGMSDLEYHRYRLQLAVGTIVYRVLRNADAQAEIDTPSIAAKPAREGEYRIAVFEDGTTQITVRSGALEIYGPRGSERIDAGRTVLVRGDPSDPEFQPTYEVARDQLDAWSEDRDRQLLASQSYRYVSPDIEGAEDLDRYGTWVPSEYGTVWAPRTTAAGWAPYSDGHWVWESYYGWSWVDYAPWGWAPYHYGRWFWNGGHGWCWWAGPVYGRHLWSPALVGFFGIGGGVGIGVGGFGGLGWVALAPFEVFHPWWGRGFYGGRGYYGGYRSVNIINVYRNARVHGGAITSNYGGFGGSRQRFGRANSAELRNASLMHGGVPVRPTGASYEYGRGVGRTNAQFATAERRNFYQPRQLSQTGRSEFGQPQMRTQQNARFGFNGNQAAGSQNRSETNGAYVSRFGQSSRGTQQGWQRFGAPGPANGFMQEGPMNGGSREGSGWHQFGAPTPQRSSNSGGNGNRFSGYSAPSGNPASNGGYRDAPAYRYSAPQQTYRGGNMNSGDYSHRSSESAHAGGGSYHGSGGTYHGGGGSSHGSNGGGGHHGR